LESSDIDGGSSVAVLTYLQRILSSLDHPELIHLILHYLLSIPEQPVAKSPSTPRSRTSARRRKSLDLLSTYAEGEERPSPALFNLVDLILASLRSSNQQTVSATLKLVSIILRRHHRYAVTTLLRIMPVAQETSRTVGAHNKELACLLSLAEEIGGDGDFDESYDSYVKDNLNLIEYHPCAADLLATKQSNAASRKQSIGSTFGVAAPRELYPHTLRPEDPLLQGIVSVLENFFFNTVETNLSITETIIDLASCGYMRLEGWLLVDPAKYEFPQESLDNSDVVRKGLSSLAGSKSDLTTSSEEDSYNAYMLALREPSWSSYNTPTLIVALRSVLSQLNYYKVQIPSYSNNLSARRQAFQVSSELSEALASSTITPSQIHSQPKPTPVQSGTTTTLDSISQRMFSTPTSVSRANSPARGRPSNPATPTPAGRLRPGHIMPPSPSPSRITFSPSPLRNDSPARISAIPDAPTFATTDSEVLNRKLSPPPQVADLGPRGLFASVLKEEDGINSSAGSSVVSGSDSGKIEEKKEISVSHLLTNAVILQDFILELDALVQVRAGVFGDVKFV
jgi:hypothetical protein